MLIGIFMATRAMATIYYVSTNGNDTTGNGSVATPWASLHKACSQVSAFGDTIHVNAGSYTDNTQCVLARGVNIAGDSYSTVSISTTANPYILASSSLPAVDGSNEISGIGFTGSNMAIRSLGRNNQKIHDNAFTNFSTWLDIGGKTPVFNSSCVGGEPTATYCAGRWTLTAMPGSTDWATGIEIYNNTVTNSRLAANTIQGALIHDNTIDNSAADRSAIGNTSYFWSGVQFYNNTIHMHQNAVSVIAVEVWEISNDTRFYNNASDGWWSLEKNPNGGSTPYSFEVYDNDFSSNITRGTVNFALEISTYLTNVRISGNYFANTGGNNTWNVGILVAGNGTHNNIIISRNIFYNVVGRAVEIDSTQSVTPYANIDNIYFYNNVVDGSLVGIQLHNERQHRRSRRGVH